MPVILTGNFHFGREKWPFLPILNNFSPLIFKIMTIWQIYQLGRAMGCKILKFKAESGLLYFFIFTFIYFLTLMIWWKTWDQDPSKENNIPLKGSNCTTHSLHEINHCSHTIIINNWIFKMHCSLAVMCKWAQVFNHTKWSLNNRWCWKLRMPINYKKQWRKSVFDIGGMTANGSW